jgi:hypothetical protein
MALLALPFAGIVGLASISLAQAPGAHWQAMLMGRPMARVPAVHSDHRHRSIRAGGLGGAPGRADESQAGGPARRSRRRGLSAEGYALYCTADSLPFVAVWYSGTMALHSRRRRPRPAVVKMVAVALSIPTANLEQFALGSSKT